MKILYISSVCAQNRFDSLVKNGLINSQFQNQKFHNLLLTGLASVLNDSIDVVSFYPVIRKGKRFRGFEEEEENGINYKYPSFLNYPVIHHIFKFLGTYSQIKKSVTDNSIIVCNIMNFDECMAALFYRCFHRIKVCAITADVPGITSGAGKTNGALWKRILTQIASPFYHSANNKYDGYLLLTEAMNGVVNTKSMPYVVVEGIADSKMLTMNNTMANKNPKKTILYAGGLHREYGIQLLVEAFKKIPDGDVELHLYGKGNYEEDLVRQTKEDTRIKYFGTRSNREIVSEQIKAHILINPRPTNEEFVKYSFPSKIMECMASGTPLLTTRLPGIPADYYPYLYFIDDETIGGIAKSLESLLNTPKEELLQKGQNAKQFVIERKKPSEQASKLLNLVQEVYFER